MRDLRILLPVFPRRVYFPKRCMQARVSSAPRTLRIQVVGNGSSPSSLIVSRSWSRGELLAASRQRQRAIKRSGAFVRMCVYICMYIHICVSRWSNNRNCGRLVYLSRRKFGHRKTPGPVIHR